MKKMLLSIIAITMCNVLMAQWNVGFTVGCSSNQYDYDTQWAYRLRYENRWGYTAEIPVSYSVNEWLKITSGIAYVEKGFFVENLTTLNDFLNPNHDSGNEIERRDCHLSVPVSAEFSFGNDRWRGFCCLGGYASYLMASYFEGYALSLSGSFEPFHEKRSFDSEVDNRFELGVVGGAGASYKFSEGWLCVISAKYYYALTDQHKDYQRLRFPAYNRTLAFQIGLVYNIK
ncbi:MAG: PorT family protein [Bacteroidales bacterium]|nr:PorT family protein [Bacteroidales bacterium]